MPATPLRLRVSPGAARSTVVGRHGDAWKLRVSAERAGGRANDAIVTLLADRPLSLPRRSVTIVAGLGARDKVVAVAGIDPDETVRRLALAAVSKNPMLGKDAQ